MSSWKVLVPLLAAAWGRANRRDLGLVAAGVAFFGVLSLFPALAALVSLYGLVGDPATVQSHVADLRRIAPPEVARLADEQLARLVRVEDGALAWSTFLSVALSLWSANRGVDGFLKALNLLDEEDAQRGLVRQTLVSLAFTAGAAALALLSIGALAAAPLVMALFPLGAFGQAALDLARWPVLLGAGFAYVAALYRFGPFRKPPPWRRVWPSAMGATLIWVVSSLLFTEYLARFAQIGEAYGSIAGAIGLLLWLYVTAYVFLFGGVVSNEVERRYGPARRSRARWRPQRALKASASR